MKNDYAFERFIINDGNREAFEIATHIAREGKVGINNPIWLQGPSGTGKTFLLYAIKNELEQKGDKRSVRLISCQELVRQILSVLKWDVYEDAAGDFIDRCCREDIIMIEDVDYCLQGKDSTQQEVCRIIYHLVKYYDRQVILTSHELLEPFYRWLTRRCGNTTVVKIQES